MNKKTLCKGGGGSISLGTINKFFKKTEIILLHEVILVPSVCAGFGLVKKVLIIHSRVSGPKNKTISTD